MNYNLICTSFLCICLVTINACKPGDTKEKPAEKSSTVIDLPGIPSEVMIKLWNECELVDYIFHDLPFSLNQSEKPAIQANLNFIATEPAGKIDLSQCKPIGREFFQIKGEIVLEADVYFSPGCYFYVFVEDNKPKYANKISEAGMNFYQQITTNVKVGQ